MATQPLDHYSLERYLELQDTFEERTEFHDGLVLPVESATPTHARLEAKVISTLEKAFPVRCAVYGSSLNLYIPSANKIVHPDATMICGPVNSSRPGYVDNPTVLVEVTSPKTFDYDFGSKRRLYFTLPSLQDYLLVSQTEKLISHYHRAPENWTYADLGPGQVAFLDNGNVEVAVEDVYAGPIV